MSKKCKAYSESKLGLEPADNRKAFYAGWDAALVERPVQQEWPKPKFVRNVDGVPCITLVEHEYLMRSRTSPQPSKPWVELTDDDIQEVRENCGVTHHAIKTIEAKLREKNTGETK